MSIVERALQRRRQTDQQPPGGGGNDAPPREPSPSLPRPVSTPDPVRQIDAELLAFDRGDQALTSEEFRVLKRPLLAAAKGQGSPSQNPGNIVQITSALAGSGKTFVSLNLALSIAAELDWRVLLVDADVVKPRISRTLQLAAPGLIDLLLDDRMQLNDALISTTNPRLTVLPAGTPSSASTELLASKRMHRLIQELAALHKDSLVIFDSPPLLQTSEARALSHYMGQVLLVVDAGVTPRSAILSAIETIDASAGTRISLVLNKHRRVSRLATYGEEYKPAYGDNAQK